MAIKQILGERLKRWERSFSIKTRIAALIAVILVPLLGISGWLAFKTANAERATIEAERFDVVNNLTYLFDARLREIAAALKTLAADPDLVSRDFQGFQAHASRVAKTIEVDSMAMFEPSGQQVMATAIPWGQPLLKRTDMSIAAPAFSGEPYVSGPYKSLTVDALHVAVSVPVTIAGKVDYVLTAGFDPASLLQLFSKAGMKPEWIFAVVDTQGRFVARSLDHAARVGNLARPELVDIAKAPSKMGVFENTTLEGVTVANSYRRSNISGWTVVGAVPKELLLAPLRKTFWTFGPLALAITALSLGATYLIALQIARPVSLLAKASQALVEGRPLPDLPIDVAEFRELKDAFTQSSGKLAHLAAIVASSGDAIISVNRDLRILTWNGGAERLFGFPASQVVGGSDTIILPRDRALECTEAYDRVFAGERVTIETSRKRKDGTFVDVALDLAPIQSDSSTVTALSLIARDITQRKEAEAKQQFFMRELSHRTKNLLSVINSMCRQTARSTTTIEEFIARFTNRMQGLAASHDLLISQNWEAASLSDLAINHVQVFLGDTATRLKLDGPPVRVSVNAAQSIGLALHELATNSVKYGALSIETGVIDFSWRFVGSDEARRLRMVWSERNGPAVLPPSRNGFGYFVTKAMVTQSLDGIVSLEYPSTGVVWSLEIPIEHLVGDYNALPLARSA